jgi:predicted nucleotidyltransferase
MPQVYAATEVMPTAKDVTEVITGRLSYENAKAKKSKYEFNNWCNDSRYFFKCTPRGLAYSVSQKSYDKTVDRFKANGWAAPKPYTSKALRYFIVSIAIGWDDLTDELKKILKYYGFTAADIKQYMEQVWQVPENSTTIANMVVKASNNKITLIEAVEKHDKLNPKLFDKDEILKKPVQNKMMEIVDEFLADLQAQEIEIKVDDVLLVGSNANYVYTKDSDIDLHIIAKASATKYTDEIANALYSAYRSLFNKSLDISIYGIPVEIYVETEKSARVSNGTYSVKNNKWVTKPIHEEIPDYDKEALEKLVAKWEAKCKALIDDIKADKLQDEKRVVKLIEDIYEKLRKKGVAKSEYAIENLAFKELRNKGLLDKLKDYRNELVSKRLSLEERLDRRAQIDMHNQIARICGSAPIIQDNGVFYIYNLKASDISRKVSALRNLPFVKYVQANESGKYDFSNPLEISLNRIPSKYYNIRGQIKDQV